MTRNSRITRRRFGVASAAVLSATVIRAERESPRRVAVIGHTGRGNFGHGLDVMWRWVPNVELVAVADADPQGLAAEQRKLELDRGFSDYEQMLREVRPNLVAVCPRHADQHAAMVLAAIGAGVQGIYVEKPFCRTPAEADRLLAAAERGGVKIAVAHRNRYHPVLPVVARLVEEGRIGRLLEIRGRGKGDRRGGAEDLWVLGSHVMNLIHYLGGRPLSCSAALLQDNRPVTADDVHDGAEGLGPLAGNRLHARYRMERGVVAYFDSVANDGTGGQGFGLQLVGSEGLIELQCDRHPFAHLVPGSPFAPSKQPRPWTPISTAGVGEPETAVAEIAQVSNHALAGKDLVTACEEDRPPTCDARQGAITVEMCCAVFESHRQDGREVAFPLRQRDNALTQLV